jgi:hypothetical protein
MAKKEKKSKKKRQAKGTKSQNIEASSSPSREFELHKFELASLVCKYETLANMIMTSNALLVELKYKKMPMMILKPN